MTIDYSSLSGTLLAASITLWLISTIYSYGIKNEFLNMMKESNYNYLQDLMYKKLIDHFHHQIQLPYFDQKILFRKYNNYPTEEF